MHSGPTHDLLAGAFFAGRRRGVYRRLVRLSGARPCDLVLDVGCGDGYLTRLVARAVEPDGLAHGIDPSAEAIDRARHIGRGRSGTYSVGSALAIDAADSTYDVVVSSLVVHHIDETDRRCALEEMRRVLRPGGTLLLAEFRPPTNRILRRVIRPVASRAMLDNQVDALGTLVTGAGFDDLRTGHLRPWIHYVRAHKRTP
jgi:ubiquinone/menaquinone biosynthesis C-methylase UbiE